MRRCVSTSPQSTFDTARTITYAMSERQRNLKTFAIVANDPDTTSAVIAPPAITAQSVADPAWSKCIPCPIATRSAAMFNTLASISSARRTPTATRVRRENRARISSPRPLPVVSAVRSQISCTADISGHVTSAAHTRPY